MNQTNDTNRSIPALEELNEAARRERAFAAYFGINYSKSTYGQVEYWKLIKAIRE